MTDDPNAEPDTPQDATPVDPDSDDGTYIEPVEDTEPAKTDVPPEADK